MQHEVGRRRYGFRSLLLLCAFAFLPQLLPAQNPNTFSLTGSVVDSATGQPVPHAVVRVSGSVRRSTFTDGEGRFQIDGLPPVQLIFSAQKPGYFSDNDASTPWILVGPNTPALVIKLTPQGAIFGRVTDSSGQPIERVSLRLTASAISDGRRRWEPRAMADTNDDGRFRFANLMPGTYYLSAGPRQSELDLVPPGAKQNTGFPLVYYPGVPDRSSAAPIQVAAGQQAEADLALSSVPVYQVSGTVTGNAPEQGVGFQVLSATGEDIWLPSQFNAETGVFNVRNVPAGSYVIKAMSQSGLQAMQAEMKVNVASDVDNLRLVLAPSVSIPVNVRMESSANSGRSDRTQRVPPMSVRLMPADAATGGQVFESYAGGTQQSGMTVQDVNPGTYRAMILPPPGWYVRSASYGPTNLLSDDLTVAAGAAGYSLDIVLRDDGATLSGTLKKADGARATIVVVPQPGSKSAPRAECCVVDNFTLAGLAPGDYLVFAFDKADHLEYANPDAIAAYESQAAHVTLTPNQKAQVSLDVIHVGSEP